MVLLFIQTSFKFEKPLDKGTWMRKDPSFIDIPLRILEKPAGQDVA